MKRTLPLTILLIFQLMLSILILKSNIIIFALVLFLLNILNCLILVFEPYWKKGAWLIFIMIIEVFIYVTSVFLIKGNFIFGVFNILSLICGIFIVMIAHFMKPSKIDKNTNSSNNREKKKQERNQESRHNIKTEIDNKTNKFENDISDSNEDEQESEPVAKKNVKIQYFILQDKIIHKPDCNKYNKKLEFKILGSKRYAQSKQFSACESCDPFI